MSGASHAADGRKLGFVESIPGDWTLRSWWLHTTESGERLEINNDQLSDQLTGKLGFKIETNTERGCNDEDIDKSLCHYRGFKYYHITNIHSTIRDTTKGINFFIFLLPSSINLSNMEPRLKPMKNVNFLY